MTKSEEDILIAGECGCPCDEVELRSDKQPDVLLLDESLETYYNDIIAIRETTDETKELVENKTSESIHIENLILNDTGNILGRIAENLTVVRQDISNAVTALKEAIQSGVSVIREDIGHILNNVLEECSEEDIYAMFDESEPEVDNEVQSVIEE